MLILTLDIKYNPTRKQNKSGTLQTKINPHTEYKMSSHTTKKILAHCTETKYLRTLQTKYPYKLQTKISSHTSNKVKPHTPRKIHAANKKLKSIASARTWEGLEPARGTIGVSWDFGNPCSRRLLIDNVFRSEQLLAGILFPLQAYNGTKRRCERC